MKIQLLCIGKTDSQEISTLIDYYRKRLPKHWNFEFTEIPDLKNSGSKPAALIKKEEAQLILNQLERGDYLILLDEGGRQYTSREFAKKIDDKLNDSTKRLIFAVGGAYGFADEIYSRANEKLSLSQMTFTHQMVRLFFVEQIYRAEQILQGKPYHND